MSISGIIISVFLATVFIHALVKKVDIFDAFLEGAKENLMVSVEILPALIGLIVCVGLLNSCGILNFLAVAISPITEIFGFPSACVPLALIKPISGSGSTAMLSSILKKFGPDSFTGRVASIICGSTETIFYTIAIYFGSIKAKADYKVITSALLADLVAVITAGFVVNLWFY